MELPLKSKIDVSIFPEADYFSQCSKNLIKDESWGVLAAALGNSKNRNTFRKAFWKPEKDKDKNSIGFHDLLYEVYKDSANDKTHLHCESFELQNKKFKSLLKDFEEFKKIGLDEYLKGAVDISGDYVLDAIRTYKREKYVFDEIMKNKSKFNKAQIERAQGYMKEVITECTRYNIDVTKIK